FTATLVCLFEDIEIPCFSKHFGNNLDLLVNSTSPLLVTLGIRNPVHKQKLSLKAMDTVLFGAPKRLHNYAKDVMLFMAVLLAIGISWFACLHHRYSQTQVKKMMKDLEALQKAEDALKKLSNELEIQQQLENQWSVPCELQTWLQLTHELEQVHFNAKRQAAERQLLAAKDGCEKIKKRKQAFFGPLRMAHSNSLDDIDQSILDARAALEEVKQDLQERLHRWHTIEILCGFPILNNPGLSALKQVLGRDAGNGARLQNSLMAGMTFEEADEDMAPTDESIQCKSIYNQIPEKQRQQIYAWAHRSRRNYWLKQKSMTNGFTTSTTLPANKTSSFLKQQTLAGATGSLTSANKTASGTTTAVSVKNGHRDVEPQGTSTVGPGSSVVFQLGDSSKHQRSHSSASLSLVNPGITNNSHLGHVQGPTQVHHGAAPTQATPSGLRISNSSGNLMNGHAINRTGSLTLKLFSSASGNHLSARAALPLSTAAAASADSPEEKIQQNGAGQADSNSSSPVDSENASASRQSPVSLSDSNSLASNMLVKTGQLEDADTASLGSIPNSQSSSVLSKSRHEPSPELDRSSQETDSLHESKEGEAVIVSPRKNGKKKTLLPKFLQKNKSKQKTA
ncbi:unnamed protein product, partial [Candidula unifasciata]